MSKNTAPKYAFTDDEREGAKRTGFAYTTARTANVNTDGILTWDGYIEAAWAWAVRKYGK